MGSNISLSIINKKKDVIFDSDNINYYKKEYLFKLTHILGMDKFIQTNPNFTTLEIDKMDEYTLYNTTIDCEPGVTMPMFILTPPETKSLTEDYPMIIIPHGHGSDGRYGVCGINRHPDMVKQQEKYNHDLGLQFVKKGYIVFCPDSRGSGDRRNIKEEGSELKDLLSCSCNDLNNLFSSLGTSLVGAWCWDIKCLIDLIVENSWGAKGHLGICGFSGGGLLSLLVSSIDDRIKCTCSSGYLFNLKDCFLESNLCGCNFIPSFHQHFELSDLGILISPRPLIIEKGLNDPLNGKRGIIGPRELNKKIEDIYNLLGIDNMYNYSEVNNGHKFNGIEIFDFFDKNLKNRIL